MSKKLYVGNLSFDTSSDDLTHLFGQYGSVTSATIVTDRDTGRSRGFAFVEMSRCRAGAKRAFRQRTFVLEDSRTIADDRRGPRPAFGRAVMRPLYSFPEPVVEAIARDRYEHPDPRVQERMEILWLKSKNEPHERIAALANVSRSTVQRTLRIFVAKGLDGIRSFGWKGQPSALTPHRAAIEQAFREHPPHTARDAVWRIEELTGVRRKESRVRTFLKADLGMKCWKVAPIPVPPQTNGRGARPNAGGAFKRRSWNRSWPRHEPVSEPCTS